MLSWQLSDQQPSDFPERFASVAGGALDSVAQVGPQECDAAGHVPRSGWFGQTDAKGLISQEAPPSLCSSARSRQVNPDSISEFSSPISQQGPLTIESKNVISAALEADGQLSRWANYIKERYLL